MPTEIWQGLVAVLLVVIGGLIALGYDNVLRRIRSLERRQSASLTALIFLVRHIDTSGDSAIIGALQEALKS